MVIQRLLMEAGADGIGDGLVTVEPRGFEIAADWATLKSPENYVGYERTEGFASMAGPPAIRLTRMRYRDDYRQTIGRYPAIGR
jgi:hypothetical protein